MLQALSAPLIFDGLTWHKNSNIIIKESIIDAFTAQIPASITRRQSFDRGVLVPGFIDLQVNGGGGVLFNNEPTIKGLTAILKAHRALGTHALLPTLITAHDELINSALDTVATGIKNSLQGLLGIHLEGPMINPKRKGVHAENNIHTLSTAIIDRLIKGDLGKVLITLAPECVDLTLIKTLTDAGITVFAGHSDADEETTLRAIEYGLKGFTHLFNAMSPMESRHPNMVGTAINDQTTWCSIINDGLHVHPAMVNIAMSAKPRDKMILVTDAMATIGSDITEFIFDGQKISRHNDQLINSEGRLAGAHLSLFQAVQNTVKLNFSFEEAINMASKNPSECLGLNKTLGHLLMGAKAYINHIDDNTLTPINLL